MKTKVIRHASAPKKGHMQYYFLGIIIFMVRLH
jgi:hypothetical protein